MKNIIRNLLIIITLSLIGLTVANAQPSEGAGYITTLFKQDSGAGINCIIFDARFVSEIEMIKVWNTAYPHKQYRLATTGERADHWNANGDSLQDRMAVCEFVDGKGSPNGTTVMATWVRRLPDAPKK